MEKLADLLATLTITVPWLAGIVLAEGFWSTAAAICMPPYAWYLFVERGLLVTGWLGA